MAFDAFARCAAHPRDARILYKDNFHGAEKLLCFEPDLPKALVVDTRGAVSKLDTQGLPHRRDFAWDNQEKDRVIDPTGKSLRAFLAAIENETGLALERWRLHAGGASLENLAGDYHRDGDGGLALITSTRLRGMGTAFLTGHTDDEFAHAMQDKTPAEQMAVIKARGLKADQTEVGETLVYTTAATGRGLWHATDPDPDRAVLLAQFKHP